MRCRCGRSTYAVPGDESLRTCSLCGYLTTYCKCNGQGSRVSSRSLGVHSVSEKTKTIVGAAVASSMGTLFIVALFSSPLVALLGFGIPFGLCTGFYAQWLRDGAPPAVATAQLALPPQGVYRSAAE